MGFAKALGHGVWETVEHPFRIGRDVVQGKPGEAWNEFKGAFGENERNAQVEAQKLGIGGWVGKHPQESVAALIATIFGGWMAAGAYGAAGAAGAAGSGAGAGAAGTGATLGGTAAGTGAGLGSAGGLSAGTGLGSGLTTMGTSMSYGAGTAGFGSGLGMTAAPTASSVLAGSGLGGSAMAATPTASSVLAGTGATGIANGAGTSALTYMPTQSTALGGTGSGIAPNYGAGFSSSPSSFNIDQFNQSMRQIQNSNQDQQKAQPMPVNYYKSSFNYHAPQSTEYSRALDNLDKLLKGNNNGKFI